MTHPFIHYSCQQIDEDDIEAVTAVLRSDWLTQGPAIDAFELALRDYCNAPHAVAVSSGTAGLHLACMALGIGAGDLVWTSPMSFVASANCARYMGAEVDFVDVDPESGNMSVVALADKLEAASRSGRMPRLVIPVHFAGRACDMASLYALKTRYGFMVMEDCAHALGARYTDGKPVGSNALSDAAVFSFHPVKPITTGEGGAVVTHNPALAAQVKTLRSHGITRDSSQMQQKNNPAWYYEQQQLGFNYRITDIQAALGASQMHKLERFMSARRILAQGYETLLQELPLRLPPADAHSGWHLYVVQMDRKLRDSVFQAMREKNIGVNVHYPPIHLHPYYRQLGFGPGQFPNAEAFFAGALSLPLHPGLSETEQDYVALALKAALT
jgi:UDP-4-amino-4,6-dideoxy-N-acetyl-beta-L-altrosamine transaminase